MTPTILRKPFLLNNRVVNSYKRIDFIAFCFSVFNGNGTRKSFIGRRRLNESRRHEEIDQYSGMPCLFCGSQSTCWMPSYTQYFWEGTGIDPNRNLPFCPVCAIHHEEYWKEMWNEYNSSRF